MRRLVVSVSCLAMVVAGLAGVFAGTKAGAAPQAAAQPPGTFHPVDSTRVFDTRTGSGVAAARVVRFAVGGRGLVPLSASAVVVNITVLTPPRSGSVSVFPGTSAWNGAASMSFVAGQTKQSMITAVLGSDGSLAVRNNIPATIQLVADVLGYYTGGASSTPGSFRAVGFRRVFDSRAAGSRPLPAGSATRVPIAGHAGLPASGMSAVVANLTVINPTRAGSVSAYASGTAWDGSASETFAAARTEQDVLTIGIGADGAAILRNNSAAPLTVVLDVLGYYLAGTPTSYGSYQPIKPIRILDQRFGPQPSRPGQVIQIQPASTPPVPRWGTPALVVRLTVITPARTGSISVFRIDRSWNGSATMSFPAGGNAQQQIVTPLGTDSHLQIRNNLSVPIIMVADVLGYYLGASNPFDVTSSAMIDPQRGSLTDVSCPTATFCMTTQQNGYFETWNGSAWSAPAKVPAASFLARVSCASSTFCLATGSITGNGSDSAVFRYDGAQWTTDTNMPIGLRQVSCASASFCLVLLNGIYRTFDGTSWSATGHAPDPTAKASLSCVSASFCMSVDTLGRLSTFDGTGWSEPSSITGMPARAVDCTSSSFCAAIGSTAAAVFDGTDWTVTNSVTGAGPLNSVSCVSSSDCFALASYGEAIRFDGNSWSKQTRINPDADKTGAISCSTAGTCAAIDITSFVVKATATTFDGTSWSTPQTVDYIPGKLEDISCASASLCIAVDSSGYAIRYDGVGWSAPVQITDGVRLSGVSCTSPSRCVAVDADGRATSYDGSSWAVPVEIERLWELAVSCSGPSFCAAVASNGTASTFDGTGWTTPTRASAQGLVKVSCASPSFCLAVDQQGGTVTFDGTHWSPSSSHASWPRSLSCPTSMYCLNIGFQTASQWRNGTWSSIENANGQEVEAVSCPSAQLCVSPLSSASLGPDVFVAWDGTEWTMPAEHTAARLWSDSAISCPTSNFCMATDGSMTTYRLDS